jgi:mannose-6-phosphate isomerase class I
MLIDLSECGIHHSWEEDIEKFPLGNVLYEVQLNVMDGVSTIRCFDQGKIADDGTVRPLHIEDYFKFIDRSGNSNNPQNHIINTVNLAKTQDYTFDRLLMTKYYSLDRITLNHAASTFGQTFKSFRHVFVKEGGIELKSGDAKLKLTQGHSAFIPAVCGNFEIKNILEQPTTVLVTY